MKESYSSMKEDFELYFANFYFILELVGDNISEEARKRIKSMVEEKNRIIHDQKEKLDILSRKNTLFEAKLKNTVEKDQNKKKTKNVQMEIILETNQRVPSDGLSDKQNLDTATTQTGGS